VRTIDQRVVRRDDAGAQFLVGQLIQRWHATPDSHGH
jgi:hypothetical protein